MKYIERHYTEYLDDLTYFKDNISRSLNKYEKIAVPTFEQYEDKFSLNGYMTNGLTLFNEYQLVLDEEKDYSQMQELLIYTLRFSLSYFNKAYHPNQMVKVQYGDKVLEQMGVETTDYMSYKTWLDFFYVYLVTRCKVGTDLFKHTTRARLIDSNIISTDEPDFCMVEFMQSLVLDEKDSNKEWQKAWDAIQYFAEHDTDPDNVLIKERMLMLEAPSLLLYQALFSGNSEAFNEQLEETLTYHKEYYCRTHETGDSEFNDSNGWISWRILACCSIAKDSGLSITIKSDYLPEWLYKGEVKDWGLKF